MLNDFLNDFSDINSPEEKIYFPEVGDIIRKIKGRCAGVDRGTICEVVLDRHGELMISPIKLTKLEREHGIENCRYCHCIDEWEYVRKRESKQNLFIKGLCLK